MQFSKVKQKNHGPGIIRWFQSLGPGIITAALVFGPGSLTITSKMGAIYGFNLLWVIVIAIFFMIIFTTMSARIGIHTDQTTLSLIRQKWGNWSSIIIGFGIFLITASFQSGNTVGASIALAELFKTPVYPWIILFTGVAISLLFFKSFYKILEKVMIIMVGIMLISFLITLLLVKPNLYKIFSGFIPQIPGGSEFLIIALTASSFSIGGAFFQSYLVKEKGWSAEDIDRGKRESIMGIIVLGVISSVILINAAAILNPQNIEVNSATDMGLALEPLFGSTATYLFMIGLFGASFSSLVGNATIGGTLLADGLSLGNNLDIKEVRWLIMAVMVIGAAVALLFGQLPIELIIFAQGITIIVAPLIGLALFFVANDRSIMGEYKNKRWINIACLLGLVLLLLMAFSNIKLLFF